MTQPDRHLSLVLSLVDPMPGLLGAGRLFLERGLDVFPHFGAGIVNRQQKLGLFRNVFKISHQGAAVLAGLQVFLRAQIFARLEQARQLVLKVGAIDGRPVRSFPNCS